MPTTAEIPTAERLAEFERLAKNHDWRFEYSDDPGVFRRGLSERNHLEAMWRSLVAAGLRTEAHAIWSRYSPRGASA
jgi:hypothetical protein